MELGVYRGCTWHEKRTVLDVFWRRGAVASSRMLVAALQYGRWAVVSLSVVAVELAVVIVVLASKSSGWGWWAALAAGANGAALAWATVRLGEVSSRAGAAAPLD